MEAAKPGRKIDIPFIKYLCESRGMQIADLCEKIGITDRTFFNKATGDTQFTYREIVGMIEVLEIDDADIVRIFFAPSVVDRTRGDGTI